MNQDFYIGYYSHSPAPLARHTRRVILLLAFGIVGFIGLAALSQNPVDRGIFEYGETRQFEGVLYESPLPTLRIVHPTADPLKSGVANLILAGAGKHGLPAFAQGHAGHKVRVKGTLIYRQNMTMVELNDPASFQDLGEPKKVEQRPRAEIIGEVTVTGELVDTKCFFGVMRPATGKIHRACAVRCLSGGVPPGLLVRDAAGNGSVLMLTGRDGQPLKYDVEWAARHLQCTGTLEQHDGLPILRVSSMQLD